MRKEKGASENRFLFFILQDSFMDSVVIAGISLIIIGFVVIALASFGSDAKIGVGGFIGPIPFGWANDTETLEWIMVATIIIAVVFLILVLRGFV